MKIDPPRPEVDVFFHNLTGLTFLLGDGDDGEF